MNKLKLIALMLIFAGLFNACNKEDVDDNSNDNNQPNVICDGNGSDSYFPMAIGNKWSYSGTPHGAYDLEITDEVTINDTMYYEVEVQGDFTYTDEFRIADNGDIYERINDVEYLFIPSNPQLGQSWDYPIGFDGMGSRNVENFSSIVETKYCTYNDYILIRERDGTGDIINSRIYVPGVGLVKNDGHDLIKINLN